MLQRPKDIIIGGERYKLYPPSIGTLLLVSEKLAQVPAIGDLEALSPSQRATEVLRRAKDYTVLPEILAILILGSKHINDIHKVAKKKWRWLGRQKREVSRYDYLVQRIRDEVTPAQLSEMIPFLLGSLQLSDFFVLTTFLQEINLAKPKKVVKTTARGQSSQASPKRTG